MSKTACFPASLTREENSPPSTHEGVLISLNQHLPCPLALMNHVAKYVFSELDGMDISKIPWSQSNPEGRMI
jgi:hypothetical protein